MANRNMTFSASLRLNTKEFRKGISDVQKSLKSLQNSFLGVAGALGLGLSFSRLGSSLMDTATKLSVAKNTLENVSKDLGEYGESLEWLRKISNKYGQDMIVLTNSFAQFRAAASSSKLTLDQMREIYEALTRAAGAYHMSADRTNDMMIAVTQMLSKGKVAAEELRRQLGNSLPGAFNLMAQAAYNAGVITENSTAALEKAMKAGKVMAEDVLPAFAKILNDVTANANFDSLQTSINRLKNSWTEFVEAGNFEKFYKWIIDGAQKVVKFFSSDFGPRVWGTIAGVFSGTIGLKWGKNFIENVRNVKSEAIAAWDTIDMRMGKMRDTMDKLAVKGTEFKGGNSMFTVDEEAINNMNLGLKESVNMYKKSRDACVAYNKELLKLNEAQITAGAKGFLTDADIATIKKVNEELDPTISNFELVHGKTNAWGAALKVLGNIGRAAINMIGTALMSLAIGAIIGGITNLVLKISEARKEANRIQNIADDMKKAVEGVSGAENERLIALTRIRSAVEAINNSTSIETKTKLINNVNEALGLTGKNLLTIKDDIETKVLPAIDDYIGKIKAAAVQQAILAQISSATSRIIQLTTENMQLQQDSHWGEQQSYQTGNIYSPIGGSYSTGLSVAAQRLQGQFDKNTQEIAELNKGIKTLEQMATPETIEELFGVKLGPGNGGGGGGGSKNTPASAMEDYLKKRQELENQYKNGAIPTEEEFKEKLEELQIQAYETLAAFDEWDKVLSKIPRKNREAAEELKTLFPANIASRDARKSSKTEAKAEAKADADIERKLKALEKYNVPKEKQRDSTFDYTKKPLEIEAEIASIKMGRSTEIQNLIDQLKEGIKTGDFDGVIGEAVAKLLQLVAVLQDVKREATDLQRKVKLSEAIEDLDKKIQDLQKNSYDNYISLAQAFDRVNNSLMSIAETFDEDLKDSPLFKSYEAFSTILNHSIQLFEAIGSVIQVVQTIQDLAAKKKIKNAAMEVAANQAASASEIEKATASAAAAAAGGAASVANIPWVGPALAVAAAISIIAAIAGAVATAKKFATGGIIGGNSYSGDHQYARVNSGEMVLNRAQQANLWSIINGKDGAGKGNVSFTIRGADLVGVLNNYDRLRN